MDKGKQLLLDIIAATEIPEATKVIINDIDISDLINKIKEDKYYLGNLSNDFISEIIKRNKYQTHIIFNKKIYQLRDLYLGKLQYNLNINDKEDHKKTIDTFLILLKKLSNVDDLTNNLGDRLNNLSAAIKYNEIINDEEVIEYITKAYAPSSFDSNMYAIMQYVTRHNYNILNHKTLEDTLSATSELRLTDISDDLKKIFKKLNIEYDELPVDYKLLIKNTSEEQITETYNFIKRNKVEDYGILHLIDKDNVKAKLAIVLFSNIECIKNVVETFRDNNNDLDVNSIKKLVNYIFPVLISKSNTICTPLYYNYMFNVEVFKKYEINTINLLNKCPLLFVVRNEIIESFLSVFGRYKADKKKVINKLYKMLVINPRLVIENLDVINKYFDINEYLKGDNYHLLKIPNLDKKINYIINKYNKKSIDAVTKLLIKEIYDNQEKNLWGDINA
jgi:hypothetical protein